MEITCQSYNFGPKEDGGYVCGLNDSDRSEIRWTGLENKGLFTVEQRYDASG